MENNVNIVIYSRVSTTIQDYNRQIEDIKKYCNAYNYTIVKEYAEKESGTKRKRTELSNLLEYVKENPVNFVIISELSRLGRTSEVLNTIEVLNSLQVGLISLKENIQTLNTDKTINHTSSMVLSILSSINSYELQTLKYRSKSGLLNSAKNGNVGGGKYKPYGYQKESKTSKKMIINEVEAETVKQIFLWYLEGKGTKQIATLLNSKEIPTRSNIKRWSDGVVYGILTNSLYKGDRRFKGEILKAPAIIEDHIFDEVQKIRKENVKKLNINKKYDYLLNERIIICGVCGKSYFAHKRASGTDNAYKCISTRYSTNCGNHGISIDKLESALKYIFLMDLIKYFTPDLSDLDNIKNEISLYEKELKKIENQHNKLVDLYTDDLIDKQTFTAKKEELNKKENEILKVIEQEKEKINDLQKGQNVIIKTSYKKNENGSYEMNGININKELIKQTVKNLIIHTTDKQLINNKQDKVLKVEINLYSGYTNTFYLSQRSPFFVYKDQNIDFPLK